MQRQMIDTFSAGLLKQTLYFKILIRIGVGGVHIGFDVILYAVVTNIEHREFTLNVIAF